MAAWREMPQWRLGDKQVTRLFRAAPLERAASGWRCEFHDVVAPIANIRNLSAIYAPLFCPGCGGPCIGRDKSRPVERSDWRNNALPTLDLHHAALCRRPLSQSGSTGVAREHVGVAVFAQRSFGVLLKV
jgi:hypothetical protein